MLLVRSILMGVLAGTFAPPLRFWIGLIIGFRYFANHILYQGRWKAAFMFGFGYWLYMLHWIYIPFTITEDIRYYFLSVFTIVPVMLMALHLTISVYVASFFQAKYKKYFAFVCIWGLLEWMRCTVSPFYPMSFVLLDTAWRGLFFYLSPGILSILLIALLLHWSRFYLIILGLIMLWPVSFETPKQTESKIALIQPAIKQTIKNTPLGSLQAKYVILGLTAMMEDLEGINIVVWPETSMPVVLLDDAISMNHIKQVKNYVLDLENHKRLIVDNRLIIGYDYKNIKRILIAGMMTKDLNTGGYYNSVIRHSDTMHVYDKNMLIPFGEYLPCRWLFCLTPGIGAIATERGDFQAGQKNEVDTIKTPVESIKAAYLICYESLFKLLKPGTMDVIFNISNDAWFGTSCCLDMHLEHLRWQAIANNACVMRCVNTGITAIIDKQARVLAKLPVEQMGILVGRVMK